MTGKNCDLFTHKSSRSYLNHLVLAQVSDPKPIYTLRNFLQIAEPNFICSDEYLYGVLNFRLNIAEYVSLYRHTYLVPFSLYVASS